MWGIGDKGKHTIDPAKLPILVHALASAEAFVLTEKVWATNQRITRVDAPNRKDIQHFVFANPACVVWLQRDQDRTDSFELILMWDGTEEDITEVYIIAKPMGGQPVGDDARAKSLLSTMLTAPSTVPASA